MSRNGMVSAPLRFGLSTSSAVPRPARSWQAASSRSSRTIPGPAYRSVRKYAYVHSRPPLASFSSRQIILGIAGVSVIAGLYAVLEWYSSLQIWPEAIRTPLKKALKARNKGEYQSAETSFRQAIDAALSLPSSALAPDPLLKLSGLYSSLAAMYESVGRPDKASMALQQALVQFGPNALNADPLLRMSGSWAGEQKLSDADHVRALALTQKMGHLALECSTRRKVPPLPTTTPNPMKWEEAAELYLTAAMTAMLRLGIPELTRNAPQAPIILGRDVDLPEGLGGIEGDLGRIDKLGLGMTMEALSEIHARKGEYDTANRLLLQTLSILLPPQSVATPPAKNRCQAAMLMTTISSYAANSSGPEATKVAKSWSLSGLQMAKQAMKDMSVTEAEVAGEACAKARCVGLYNLGVLAARDSDTEEATKYLDRAILASREIGYKEGEKNASDALRRIGATTQF